jgi:hypothetical protein
MRGRSPTRLVRATGCPAKPAKGKTPNLSLTGLYARNPPILGVRPTVPLRPSATWAASIHNVCFTSTAAVRYAPTRLPRRLLDRIRSRCIDRDFAHRERDRQRSGTKQRHDPERVRAEGAIEWTGHQRNCGGHRTDREAAICRLSGRSQGRRDNHRQHLHASKMCATPLGRSALSRAGYFCIGRSVILAGPFGQCGGDQCGMNAQPQFHFLSLRSRQAESDHSRHSFLRFKRRGSVSADAHEHRCRANFRAIWRLWRADALGGRSRELHRQHSHTRCRCKDRSARASGLSLRPHGRNSARSIKCPTKHLALE